MLSLIIVAALLAFAGYEAADAQQLAPNGTWVGGTRQMAPNGTYVGVSGR
jgi:hypothetical protein